MFVLDSPCLRQFRYQTASNSFPTSQGISSVIGSGESVAHPVNPRCVFCSVLKPCSLLLFSALPCRTPFLYLRTQSRAARGERTYVDGVDGSELLQQTGHVLLLGPLVQLAHPQSGAAHWETKGIRRAE